MTFYRSMGKALALFLLSVSVDASCGSASCPYDTQSTYATEKGLVRLGYTFEFLDQDQPRISTRKARAGEIRGHHDEQRTINRIHRLSGSIGVSDRLRVDASLPVSALSHRHVHHHHGRSIPSGWDFTALGDLSIESRYAVWKPTSESRPTLYSIIGVEMPTGKSRVVNASGEEAEPGITPGSKSWDFKVGAASLQHFSVPMAFRPSEYAKLPMLTSLSYTINGKGREDYRLGNVLNANLGTAYPLHKTVAFLAQLNYLVREKDDRGRTSEEIQKTGGSFLYVSPGLQIRPLESVEWSAVVQLPVYQRVNRIQLTSDYNLLTHLSWRFQL